MTNETIADLKTKMEAVKAKYAEKEAAVVAKEKQLSDLQLKISGEKEARNREITALDNTAKSLRTEIEKLESERRNIKPDDVAKKEDYAALENNIHGTLDNALNEISTDLNRSMRTWIILTAVAMLCLSMAVITATRAIT